MDYSEKKLEENELKIDRVLHQVIDVIKQIKQILRDMHSDEDELVMDQKISQIKLLTETAYNLVLLADEVDVVDENMTVEVEEKITEELHTAVDRINTANKILEQENPDVREDE